MPEFAPRAVITGHITYITDKEPQDLLGRGELRCGDTNVIDLAKYRELQKLAAEEEDRRLRALFTGDEPTPTTETQPETSTPQKTEPSTMPQQSKGESKKFDQRRSDQQMEELRKRLAESRAAWVPRIAPLAKPTPEGWRLGNISGAAGKSMLIYRDPSHRTHEDFDREHQWKGDDFDLIRGLKGITDFPTLKKCAADLADYKLDEAPRGNGADKAGFPKSTEDERKHWPTVMPVPADAPLPKPKSKDGYRFEMQHTYRDRDDRVLWAVDRLVSTAIPEEGKKRLKSFRPWTWRHPPGQPERGQWVPYAPADRSPLYGQERLPGATRVLLVEGERKADIAQAMALPAGTAVLSYGATGKVERLDFSPLQGLPVVGWPDHDASGRKAMVAALLRCEGAGARDPRMVVVPADFPDAWDLADDWPGGEDDPDARVRELIEAAIPVKQVVGEPAQQPGALAEIKPNGSDTTGDGTPEPESEQKPKRKRRAKAKASVEGHLNSDPDLHPGDGDKLPAEDEPAIRLVGGELPRIVDEAEAALLARPGLHIYQRAGLLVRPSWVEIETADGGTTMGHRLNQVIVAHLVECLTLSTRFQKYDKREKRWHDVDCPKVIAETYLARIGWQVPTLAGVIHAPSLRRDGSVLDCPGFDAATRILYEPDIAFPQVPQNPSREDALAALKVLKDLIEPFRLVDRASTAAALAALITPGIRRSVPHAPLFAITAPLPGSGKSKLVSSACFIWNGHDAPVTSQGDEDRRELDKGLAASLIAGDGIVSIDNCDHPLGGSRLCQMISQLVLRIRDFGRLVNMEVPSNGCVYATGNNLVLFGDIIRRSLLISMDPGCERPETRIFDKPPPDQLARMHRQRYAIAALTVLRAYIVAGMPEQGLPALGGFENWCRMVRDALVWLDEDDCCGTIETLRANEPKLTGAREVMTHWADVFGTAEMTVRAVVERAIERGPGDGDAPGPLFNPDMRQALLAVAGNKGRIDNKRLGDWLRTIHNRIIDGRRFVHPPEGGAQNNIAKWCLEKMHTPTGEQDQ